MSALRSHIDDENSGPVFGSGSFLADRGYQDPDAQRLKVFMADEITTTIAERKLTHQQIANMTGLAQPDVSRIVNGIVKDYSIERLLRVMTTLGKNVHVVWTDASEAKGSVLVGIPAHLLDSLREQALAEEPEVPEQPSAFSI